MSDLELLKSIDDKLSAIISILLINNKDSAEKEEVILARVGLAKNDIAKITGKTLTAVQKSLERARKK
jgi:DNA-directed RNA polymerase specialized sigma24 family protein